MRARILSVGRHVGCIAGMTGWAAAHRKVVWRVIGSVANSCAIVVDRWIAMIIQDTIAAIVIARALVVRARELDRALVLVMASSSVHSVALWFDSKRDASDRELE